MISGYTTDKLKELDPDLLRAIIREKAHHTVEYPLYLHLFAEKKMPPRLGDTLGQLLGIWKERELPADGDDIQWCYSLLALAKKVRAGEKPNLSEAPPLQFSAEEQAVIQKVIETRRSVRIWQMKPVPPYLIELVINSGIWAPHSCNLQTLRFAVLEAEKWQGLFRVGEITGWQVCIAVGQDMRPYDCFSATIPSYNQDLDCGAAVQNMLLCAHSLGLGAVWATFGRGEAEAIHSQLNLPEYIRLRTYIAMGWPAQVSLPPGRLHPNDVILYWG
jgi:nitroreductase